MRPQDRSATHGTVTVVGSVNIDRSITLERFPGPGETLSATSLTTSVGGKGANQATAAAHAGATVRLIGSVGDDQEGVTARTALHAAGVDTSGLRETDSAPTGTAWICVAAGDNTVVVVPGANHVWPQAIPAHISSDVTLCQLEIPSAVVQRAAATPGLFLLNAAPSRPLADDLLARCDVVIVNEHELADLSGAVVDPSDAPSVLLAAHSLLARGARAVVTTLGAAGAVTCTATEAFRAHVPDTPTVVDTTGAGDAFCGVLAAGLAGHRTLVDAVRRATAAGSLAVRHATAQGGYADFAHIDAILAETPCVTTLSMP